MAAKKKTIAELKEEQKTLADLIRKKEKEAEKNALSKMGMAYIKFLIENETTIDVKSNMDKVNLSEDELEIIRDKYEKAKKQISTPEQTTKENSSNQ